jgi:hypothetical protein
LVPGTLLTAIVLFALAVVVHIANYALLLHNRSTLLNPIVAGVATWAEVAASVLACVALVASFVVLTRWLISRRAGAYARHEEQDPRPAWELWLGCLMPLANLFWAPVYVFELARLEGRLTWLRTRIVVWWCAWWVSLLLSIFAFATSFTQDAQGIADNTVATTIAYLAALAALLLTVKMYRGFEHTAVDRPVRRWVMVPDEARPAAAEPEPVARVEPEQDHPAA